MINPDHGTTIHFLMISKTEATHSPQMDHIPYKILINTTTPAKNPFEETHRAASQCGFRPQQVCLLSPPLLNCYHQTKCACPL